MFNLNFLWQYLPLECLLCEQSLNRHDFPWCDSCHQALPRSHRCLCCGLPTAYDIEGCGNCIKHPPAWDRLFCLDRYKYPYNALIKQFKYQGKHYLGKSLACLLQHEIKDPAPLLLPVPMHWQRHITRGYNQSNILANKLAKLLNVKCDLKKLSRIRATKQQQGLNKKSRLVNLNGAFSVGDNLPKHVAIVDDVVTTGTTVSQICGLLRKQGVEQIDIYCLTRSDGKHQQ